MNEGEPNTREEAFDKYVHFHTSIGAQIEFWLGIVAGILSPLALFAMVAPLLFKLQSWHLSASRYFICAWLILSVIYCISHSYRRNTWW